VPRTCLVYPQPGQYFRQVLLYPGMFAPDMKHGRLRVLIFKRSYLVRDGRGSYRQGLRFTISESTRREILNRILLSHRRYAKEAAADMHGKGNERTFRVGREVVGPRRRM